MDKNLLDLPIEIVLYIIKYVKFKDLSSLRLTNSEVKSVIDNKLIFLYLFSEHINSLRLSPDAFKFDYYENFIKLKKNLYQRLYAEYVNIASEKNINHPQNNEPIDHTTNITKYIDINFVSHNLYKFSLCFNKYFIDKIQYNKKDWGKLSIETIDTLLEILNKKKFSEKCLKIIPNLQDVNINSTYFTLLLRYGESTMMPPFRFQLSGIEYNMDSRQKSLKELGVNSDKCIHLKSEYHPNKTYFVLIN